MKRSLLAFYAAALLCVAPGTAAPVAPGHAQLSGDVIELNQQFHINYYNFRIQKLQWVPNTSAFALALQDGGVSLDDGKGVLMIFAAVKSTASDAQELPIPAMQALFKDGTQSTEENRDAYTPGGKEMSGDYQPGQGASVIYFIENMPQPSVDNPLTKLILKPNNGGDNDSGASKVFRMLNPPVVP